PTIGLPGVSGWGPKGRETLCIELEQISWQGRPGFIAFDSDLTTNPDVADQERRRAKQLTTRGAIVRCVRLPDGPPGSDGKPAKVGLDDFLIANGAGPLRKLLDEAIETETVEGGEAKRDSSQIDPATEAAEFLAALKIDRVCRLLYWSGSFWFWR